MDYLEEELESLDYGKDFEDQYADELEALQELEDDAEAPLPKTKRKLDFGPELESDEDPFGPVFKRPKKEESSTVTLPDSHGSENLLQDISKPAAEKLSKIDSFVPRSCQFLSNRQLLSDLAPYEKISFTSFDGSIHHMRLKEETCYSQDFSFSKKKVCLLSKSYAELREEAFRLIELKSHSQQDFKENNAHAKENYHGSLWVEKYKPSNFLELLSDDGINRALLSWLKLWDKVVFNREVSKKVKKDAPQFKTKFQEVVRDLDDLGRPQQKMTLLCGPPGLGKTTLAYIIAKQAGYNVVEMNASDDRSPDVFKRQLEAATQMRSVLGEEPRPNCLIIDEIDGAAAPAINALVAFSKNTKKSVLLRPVICICNDLYVPALRPLRQISLVLMFPPTCISRLVARLLDISRLQQLKTDRSALLALCQKTDSDIRSCLGTIQFLHSLKGELRLQDVKTVNVGQKDTQISMFTVWQKVFQMPRSEKKPGFQNHVSGENNSSRIYTILKLAMSCGENEKVIQGLFENYLNVSYRDPELKRTTLGADWLCFASELQNVIQHMQIYMLMPYLNYVVPAFHLLFAVIANVTISYPSAQFEFKSNLTKRENIIQSMLQDLTANARRSLKSQEIVLSFLPNLVQIVQPSLRPVNTQLYSNREKLELVHVVDVMVTYNLNYRQERNAEGLYHFVLEPNIEDIVMFPGQKVQNNLTYSAKQLLARELELERMRRNEHHNSEKKVSNQKTENPEPKVSLPNHQQVLKSKAVKDSPAEERDYFGRKVTKVMIKETEKLGSNHIWFRFKEGYTNAARKTLYIKDLL